MMMILHDLLTKLKNEFTLGRNDDERAIWFIYTLIAIIIPFTSSKTSNLLRCFRTLFGFESIGKKRYYRFMASPKIRWNSLWARLWKLIPDPLTNDRLILAVDDYINIKTGKKIFGCGKVFDHAAKQNQSKYPWAQNIVTVGLLKMVKGRWACLPLNYRFYHLKKSIENTRPTINRCQVQFQTKLEQAAGMITDIAQGFANDRIIAVTDSWFGNNGLWSPAHKQLGERFHMVSRLRSNNNLYDLPRIKTKPTVGRPKKYGKILGDVSTLAAKYRPLAHEYEVNLYGRFRPVIAYDQVVMLKTLKHAVRVVWIYRRKKWVALFSTDLTLSVQQIIEYYGARWKIEATFKELKRELGSAGTQSRHPNAVTNHLHFCMMACSLTWIYASRIEKTPNRRHVVKGRNHFAFSDVRRLIAQDAFAENFSILFPVKRNSIQNSLVATLMRIAA